MPLFHVNGSLTQTLATLAGSGCLVILARRRLNPSSVRNIWPLVQRYRPAVLGSVPTVLAATLAVPTDGFDTSSLKVASGGRSIPVAIRSALQARLALCRCSKSARRKRRRAISYADRPVRLGSVGGHLPYSRCGS
ncbi:MAG: hypothetical protein U1E30_04710 [Rhodoblastus sp.]